MMITEEEVKKIAKLAKLRFSEKEIGEFTTKMANVLEFFKKLEEVKTEGVEETSQVTGLMNVSEDDTIEICEHAEDLLECSPHPIENHSVKIPKIL